MFAPAQPRVVMLGAGPIGQAVAYALAPLPFTVDWLASDQDHRPEAAGTAAQILSDDDLEACVAAAPPGVFFAIFTHSRGLDYRLARAALTMADFAYLGMLGSRKKRAGFEARLKADGFSDGDLARLTCPMGLAAVKGKAPAMIAVSLAAELLALTQVGDEPG